jgi:hypothetical protein
MSFEFLMVLMLIGAFGGIVVVVLNDWTKRVANEKAQRRGKKPKRDLGPSQTDWKMVISLVVGIALYTLALANHEQVLRWHWGFIRPFVEVLLSPVSR